MNLFFKNIIYKNIYTLSSFKNICQEMMRLCQSPRMLTFFSLSFKEKTNLFYFFCILGEDRWLLTDLGILGEL